MPRRKEVVWSLSKAQGEDKESPREDIQLTFTRKGIIVNGHYDTFVGMGPDALIPWDVVLRYKAQVEA